jgi:zinc transporter ZupT
MTTLGWIVTSGLAMSALALVGGNLVNIAASDLVPEVKHGHGVKENVIRVIAFVAGILLLAALRVVLEG